MYCHNCGGTEGFTKVTEISFPVELQGLNEDEAYEAIGEDGRYEYEDDIVILCTACDLRNIESVMWEEE